ncbi:MAG: hypothetical protein COV74_10665 [Candidatus Omnitrophica bacterium CG11_big_fil_rev_8_21_14_0_20_45_26]|uniref:Pyruvate, phosphate dikinase regulatory protein n=1 Tax=Candidatus Abzuiibacterium crystallinum TaxID=1974748 RepID=A0A2H0LKW2_9BACT|nr:MAG: hypothetical protein COV74_10665 [Candidatus Omnitrophica bacterium CG11_big_fil_rev_8_21_14_0_20_45_26]PIW63872.1 MAG: hypothetical protein COW12_08145 [Candidatus Omnitrophica bacterium CG12_big_fil_rev_8_21_14_0_65_45_16]
MAEKKIAEKKIALISDSTGDLGERFVFALTTQLPSEKLAIVKFNFVTDMDELTYVFKKIHAGGYYLIFHTVLSEELKNGIETMSREKKIPAFDLTGPPTDFLIKHLKVKPSWDVKSLHKINETYDKRINAMEFTTNHDDGLGLGNLKGAEIILIGPSRTSKTPTSIFLAIKGFRVANIPIVQSVDVGDTLSDLAGDQRVFGFTIKPEKLQEVRNKRIPELGITPPGYTDLEIIYQEVEWAEKMYRKYKWQTVDITDRAIEETAALIERMIRKYRLIG